MKNTLNSSALLLIDFQEGFLDEHYWGGNRNNKNAEEVAAGLLAKWRELGWPVFHSQHASVNPKSPLHPSHPGHQFHSLLQPLAGEHVVVKNVNSSFIGTDLEQTLRSRTINSIVIAGLITNHCVSTTARMAGNLGFHTVVVSDATATFDRRAVSGEIISSEIIHKVSMADLNEEFATVLTSQQLTELLSDN